MHYQMTDDEKEHLIKGELVNNDEEKVSDESDICYYDNPFYPDQDCSYICDDYLDNEWRMDYVLSYNEGGNTVFVYHAFVESNVNELECTKREHNEAQTLHKVYLRVSCACNYQSDSFLETMTVKMEPFGEVHQNHWSWTLDLREGQMQELKLVIKGENVELAYSDMTLVGADRRCTSFNKVKTPNPCRNECNFGEWSKWSSFGDCSAECGGGHRYKTRSCVSICDGITKVDNCFGENNHMSICNTNPCKDEQDIIDQQK